MLPFFGGYADAFWTGKKKTVFFECFPLFAPSLSWQNDAYKWRKKTVVFLHLLYI
jgi:hypothetical protein